MADLDQFVEKP